jgi:hypothetical protein
MSGLLHVLLDLSHPGQKEKEEQDMRLHVLFPPQCQRFHPHSSTLLCMASVGSSLHQSCPEAV